MLNGSAEPQHCMYRTFSLETCTYRRCSLFISPCFFEDECSWIINVRAMNCAWCTEDQKISLRTVLFSSADCHGRSKVNFEERIYLTRNRLETRCLPARLPVFSESSVIHSASSLWCCTLLVSVVSSSRDLVFPETTDGLYRLTGLHFLLPFDQQMPRKAARLHWIENWLPEVM